MNQFWRKDQYISRIPYNAKKKRRFFILLFLKYFTIFFIKMWGFYSSFSLIVPVIHGEIRKIWASISGWIVVLSEHRFMWWSTARGGYLKRWSFLEWPIRRDETSTQPWPTLCVRFTKWTSLRRGLMTMAREVGQFPDLMHNSKIDKNLNFSVSDIGPVHTWLWRKRFLIVC